MTVYRLVYRSFIHYFKKNLTVALGIAVSTAVIAGALVVGDSVRHSLELTVQYRLGKITHSVSAADRYFPMDLSRRLAEKEPYRAAAAMILDGMAVSEGGRLRVNRVQILGTDSLFIEISSGRRKAKHIAPGEAVISENLASRLNLKKNDYFILRIRKASLIPLNTPLVSDAGQSVSQRIKVAGIAGKYDGGRFNLRISQTAPYNAYLNICWLNELMELEDKANAILIAGNDGTTSGRIQDRLDSIWELRDVGLNAVRIKNTGEWEIQSDHVFIDKSVTGKLIAAFPESRPLLTYFANDIICNKSNTPYSFVSGIPDSLLPEHSIVLNNWTADDLSASTGDSCTLRYFRIGPLRELGEDSAVFIIREIVPVENRYGGSDLVPQIPGLTDAGNCRDWEAGVPIDFNKIRNKDEKYWLQYRGTPKAYIRFSEAERLWENRFGNITALRIPAASLHEAELHEMIRKTLNPSLFGFRVNEVKKEGLRAARNGVDFSQLFLGLSFFILISGIILASLLIIYNLEQRSSQIGTYSALGYPKKLTGRIFMGEGLITAFLGSLIGIFLAVYYTKMVFFGLNRMWQDIVRTDILVPQIRPLTLTAGFFAGIIISLVSIRIIVYRYLKYATIQVQHNVLKIRKSHFEKMKTIAAWIFIVAALILTGSQFMGGGTLDPSVFFISGSLLLLAFLLLSDWVLILLEKKPLNHIGYSSLSVKNLVRSRTRSLAIIILLSLGVFVVVTTGANRRDVNAIAQEKTSGTGGFAWVAETSIPVSRNLNLADTKTVFALPGTFTFVQFSAYGGDDASCLNLNRVAGPRILGVDAGNLAGRFSFVTKTDDLDENEPWRSLDKDMGEVIPAIADQTVIQWGLGKKIGDTLTYYNASGKPVRLKLIGGLANSVFQGNLIISGTQFLKQFPSSGGSVFFLIDEKNGAGKNAEQELSFIFRDYGWEITPAAERLAEFDSVQNTYLRIFMVLGALGVLLGTIGLAVVLLKSMYERRNELAVLIAMGFTPKAVFALLFREYAVLLLAGIAGGTAAAILSVLPAFISGYQNISAGFILFLIAILLVNGLVWISLIALIRLKKLNIIDALRNE